MTPALCAFALVALLSGCDVLSDLDGGAENLGEFDISDTGDFVDVTLSVSGSDLSVMAYCGGFGDDALGAVFQLTDPSGNVYAGDALERSGFRSDFVDDLSPMVLPMNPDLPLVAGDWQVQWFIGAGNGGSVDCGLVRRTGSVSSAATIAVEIVLVGIGIDAAAAPDDANLQAALDQLTAEWATANLEPTFTFVDFDGDLDRFAVVDIDTGAEDYRELNDLLRTANPIDSDTLTFFLVQELRNSGSTILGLAAGPPGAAGLSGTSKSGVIVTAADLASAPADVGKIMAHEGGHFLGLYHTTERDGALNDPLGDTPECPASANTGGGTFSADECAAFDGTNVMFWTLTSGSASLTSDQSYVLRHNPIVQ